MKIKIIVLGIVCMIAAAYLVSCKSERKEGDYMKLKPEEAKEKIDGDESIIIVDVRTQEEYEQGHIPGAVLIPVESIGEEIPKELPDKDAEIMVYCRTGVRSKKAAHKLLDLGYTRIEDIGGIVDWPYEVTKD